ncbi:UBP-type zinc finger domain-containing protein [Streptomyces sp. NBC_01298]|uniref:UBP-type zinc finger domain-containing protein n=1 Tax=Streptomyces sp. NBC_01298 TaxID=2903817 RepID=UPI002E131714|nr:UBP-type zinc finger domain-containing protein [Streptomyces sp. NBC_01298]
MGRGQGWKVAPDGGRPRGRTCTHAAALPPLPAPGADAGCAQCRSRGWNWVRLRVCLSCGHVGCCDSSRGHHAHDHYVGTGHPVAVSIAPDEDWAWCFPDEVFLVRA